MILKRTYLQKHLTIIAVFCATAAPAQDPYIANTSQSLIYLNPSFAGSNGLFRSQLTYQVEDRYMRTYFHSLDGYFRPLKGGLAFSYRNDQMANYITTQFASLAYAPVFHFSDRKLEIIPSVQFSYFDRMADMSMVTFEDLVAPGTLVQFPVDLPSSLKTRNADVGVGLLLNYGNWHFGFAALHLTQPNQGLFGSELLYRRYNVHAAYNLALSERTLLNFSMLCFLQRGDEGAQLLANAVLFRRLMVGAGLVYQAFFNYGISRFFSAGYRADLFTVSTFYNGDFSSYGKTPAGRFGLNLSLNIRPAAQRHELAAVEKW